MLMATMPIAVIMERRIVRHPWADVAWAASHVVADHSGLPSMRLLSRTEERESYLMSGLQLELYPDENDGYFENWAAPQPKVFVLWRMAGQHAQPVTASVSYGEGARMLDSGECADGVAMPAEIYAWLTQYLRDNYQPRPRRGRQHG